MSQRGSRQFLGSQGLSLLRAMMLIPLMVLGFVSTPSLGGTAFAQSTITCDPLTPAASSSTVSAATPEASPAATAEFPDDGGELTVFAAASLTDAFAQIGSDLEAAHPGLTITFQTAGSQALVTQLQEGATADVLATANTSTMTTAIESGLIEGDSVPFTGNRLVIVTPSDNPAGITSLDDLTNDGVKLVIAGSDVPAGSYAVRAICDHQNDGVEGFANAISANIVSEETDVRSVLSKVQLGEADAGIVYLSDAVASEIAGTELNLVEFPDTVPTSATYPIAAVEGGNTELANAFIAYVLSPEGQAVLETYGFELP